MALRVWAIKHTPSALRLATNDAKPQFILQFHLFSDKIHCTRVFLRASSIIYLKWIDRKFLLMKECKWFEQFSLLSYLKIVINYSFKLMEFFCLLHLLPIEQHLLSVSNVKKIKLWSIPISNQNCKPWNWMFMCIFPFFLWWKINVIKIGIMI